MRFTAVILSALICCSARAEGGVSDKDSDEAIMAAAEKMVSEGKALKTEEGHAEIATKEAATSAEGAPSDSTAPALVSGSTVEKPSADLGTEGKKESEIPLFTKSEKLSKSEGSLIWRLVGSIAIIAFLGLALIVAARRWTRQKNKGGEKARIEILHQFHLGPKKSLALVRVAGEAILIGCTDHSINMLKTVTLIDDELEGVLGKDFNGFLEDDFKIEDMRTALTSRNLGR